MVKDVQKASASSPWAARLRPSWVGEVSGTGWRALLATAVGWGFEVFDIALLSLTIPAFLADFHVTRADVGIVAAVQAIGLIVGGIVGGGIADRIGRVRTFSYAVGGYALFTGLTAAASSLTWVEVLRLLAGLAMGAAWTAGAALVAETWPPAHRGKSGALMQAAVPLGNMLAVGAAAVVTQAHHGLDNGGWRILYLLGALPLLAAVYIRLRTPESPIWLARDSNRSSRADVRSLADRTTLRPMLLAFAFVFFLQYLFYGVSTFLPTYLVQVDGIEFVTSLGYLVVQQLGSVVGFIACAVLVDRWGRRPTFITYLVVCACAISMLIGISSHDWVLAATFLAGVGIAGVFAGAAPWTAEMLYRSPARGLAMGVAYNTGRLGGALGPYVVGVLAVDAVGFRYGLGTAVVAAVLAVVVMIAAPETRGRELMAATEHTDDDGTRDDRVHEGDAGH